MAITVVGNLDSATGTALTTLTLTAAAAVGDVRVLVTVLASSSINVSSISGGNATTWTRVAGPTNDTNASVKRHEIWIGTVANGNTSGHETITITWASSTAGLSTDLDCRTFSNSNSGTTWAIDGSQSGFANNASSATITYPSLTAAGSGELYVGHSRTPSGGSYGTPTGGGFTWVTATDANGNPYIYSVSAGSGTVAPTQSTTASVSHAIGVLLIASTATTHALAATGLASSSGSFLLGIPQALASTGLASSSGSFLLGIPQPLAATGLASSTGSFLIGIPQALAATGLAASTGAMDMLVRRVIAAAGLASSSGSFLMLAGHIQDPFAVAVAAARPNILDCGVWRVFLATRGGGQLLAELDYETLTLSRKLNDVSTCSVTVLGAKNEECIAVLSDIEPFQHEIVAFRNYRPGDSPSWAGPVTLPSWDPLNLNIGARDLFTWVERRTLPFTRIFNASDLADIFGGYLADALVQDASPNITAFFLGEIGITGARTVTAASNTIAGDALRELSRSGVDFTCVGRTLRYGGTAATSASTILYDPAIYQDPGGATPKLTKQGLNMATRVVVKAAQDAALNQIVSTVGFPDAEHGLISQVVSEPLILDRLSATHAAADRLAFLNPAPQYLSCVLTPQAPIRFDELIPGIRIDTAFSLGLTNVEGTFRLQAVDVSSGAAGEVVGLTLVPLVV